MKVIDDIDSFITSFFGDRISTPLYSTFAISWSLWNWKIYYVTFIVDSDQLPDGMINKLDYTLSFVNWCDGFIFPIVSTAAIIFALPYAANYTYKKSLEFKSARMQNKTRIIDKDRSFTRTQVDAMIEGYIARAKNLDDEIAGYQRQLKVEKDISQSYASEKKDFKVLSASYGVYGLWKDVISDMSKLKENFPSFEVSNNSFTIPDPVPNVWKQLVITYQNENVIHSVSSNEGDRISFEKGQIVVTDGNATSDWKKNRQENTRTTHILVGTWTNIWMKADGTPAGSETFIVTNDFQYIYLDGKHQFNIKDIRLVDNKSIEFIKQGVQPDNIQRKLINVLIIVNNDTLVGTEQYDDVKYSIKYLRVN